jgi:hypothetical protein
MFRNPHPRLLRGRCELPINLGLSEPLDTTGAVFKEGFRPGRRRDTRRNHPVTWTGDTCFRFWVLSFWGFLARIADVSRFADIHNFRWCSPLENSSP